ncbi:hypothetical protein EV421DRAFT_923416 [Armillaria borealis]|uniref:Uncharacterized protein n=1 Tax=Armillaria borealis TaxID=47425 RepID=A0AA39K1J7_9AGAR|nr:hypothetical protein EV421DRAFT_923416 [Armillaria borealis]
MISLSLRTSNTEPPSPTPPSTPRPTSVGKVANFLVKIRRNVPAHCTESSSGDAPQSHFGVEEGMECQKREPMEVTDTFICLGAVNVKLLLRASRGVLLETAEHIGGNVLIDERYVPRIHGLFIVAHRNPRWTCTIREPKNRNGTFKVQIRYSASAARSSHPDPHRPVSLDCAKSIPGLMTIVKRNDI